MFSDVGDFTPVCTTELAKMAEYSKVFKEKGVKLIGLSCDDVSSHNEWIKDIEAYSVSFTTRSACRSNYCAFLST